jgi:hypothetical protein
MAFLEVKIKCISTASYGVENDGMLMDGGLCEAVEDICP